MSVALEMDQRKVADWPRSMLRGSAVKLLIRGADTPGGGGAGGGSVLSPCVGGGAVATGVFFLHPAEAASNTSANTAALSVLGLILIRVFPLP
jgi:hypothetical protein